jgi:hypothetical protein
MSFNAVIVSGSSYDTINGTYIEDGIVNGKNKYSKDSDSYIFWYDDDEITSWTIQNNGPPEFIGSVYDASEDVEFPWEVEFWADFYNFGVPTLTPIDTSAPSQNTFGLPAESVALITSRFGSVANFLRLRNQGQI